MRIIKAVSSHTRTSTLKRKTKSQKSSVEIYPMMPRKYTAAQRAALRKFEKELMTGRKVVID